MKKLSHPSGSRYFLFFILVAALFLTAFQAAEPAGGISPWVWLLVLIVLLVIAWWYFRSQRSESAPVKMESAPHPTPAADDDLTMIEGIGPKISAILRSAGITAFSQLAAMDADRVREILEQGGIRLVDTRTWTEQASLAAAGDQEGLEALQDRLKGGRAV